MCTEQVESIVVQLRDRGMRLTPQRLAVLKTIIGNKEHLNADEIYERVRGDYPMIGLATIYKTVTMLKEMGAISELNFSHHSARYDGSGAPPHPHFVCNYCNQIPSAFYMPLLKFVNIFPHRKPN